VISILPPNATPLERGLEAGLAPLLAIQTPLDTLLDPATIDEAWLPWLAYALSVDSWDAEWPEVTKRAVVAESIGLHRIKGTREAVDRTLRRLDALADVVEWHQQNPRGAPHTFDVMIPLNAEGGTRATAAFAEAIIDEISRVKPLREHLTVVQSLMAGTTIGVHALARPMLVRRDDADLVEDHSRPWSSYLQTEDGEPLQFDDGEFLDTRP